MVKFICIKPAEYKKISTNFTIIYGLHESPLGKCIIGITSTEKAILHLRFVENDFTQRLDALKSDWPGSKCIQDATESEKIVKRVFSADDIHDVTIYLKGTDFQINVWKALVNLPKGTTVGYNYVANMIGSPKAIRAVAKTVNANQIAFIIPCHRVLSKSGPSKTCWRTGKRDPMLEYERKIFDLDKKPK